MKALATYLMRFPNLQTLDLEDNMIGADGAKALADCLKHCTKLFVFLIIALVMMVQEPC